MNEFASAAALRAALFAAISVCAIDNPVLAQTLPSPWTAKDIGSPALAGSATHNSGVFTISGAGYNIWGTSDQFVFMYQQILGDVDISAKIDDLAGTRSFSKAGVMIRNSLNANSAHLLSHVTVGEGVRHMYRLSDGATTSGLSGAAGTAPVWVRAVRKGNQVSAYWSSTGTSWTLLGTQSIALGASAYVGIAVGSVDSSARATAVVSNVKVVTTQPSTLPPGQQAADIGAPATTGSTSYSSGTYTIKAAGRDIWDTSDQFHFVYQQVTGNVELVARVASITKVHAWSKAGVMVRESLAANARHAMMVTSASKGDAFQRRLAPGAYTEHTSGGHGTPPGWVRIVRTGDLFEAYQSADGANWTKVGSDTIAMGDTVYVGLAATSHNETLATTAIVDHLKITAAALSSNRSPSVSITSPAAGTQVTLPTTVTVAATASDAENRMLSVDFYADSTLILRDTSAPYSASWTPSTAGTYSLTAVAHDADGASSTSSAVSLAVNTITNRAPSVSLTSPLTGASFAAPATVTLAATASDPENQLARVDFYVGSTRVGTDTSAPYSFSWTNVAAGTYSITARAFDAAGASATSAAASITVGTSTVTTAPRTVAFTASADHATKVTSYVLKVFAATANTATATPIATSDLGKPTPTSTGEITVDRATFFSGLATSTYQATVTAVGSGGESQSSAVTFTR